VGDDALKPTWIVGSALLVAFLIWKRRKLEPTLLAGGAIVAVAAFVYGLGLIHLPNLEQLLIDIGERLGTWTYLLVGGLAFLETGAFIGLIAPGETALLLGGVVAGQGQIEIIAMVGIVWAAAVAGDMTSFFLGRRLGRAFLVKHGPKVQITEERLHQVEGFFDRHGGKAILIGRFVGLVRAIAPFLAGSSGMPLRRFAPYDVVGAGLWGTTFVLLGYIFWQSFSTLLDYAKKGALGLGIAIVVIVGLVWLFRWQRVPENRAKARAWLERQAERPALRPLARVLRPVVRTSRTPARFVWDRVTPGELGLSLTTLVAIAGVGGFFFIADLVAVTDKTFVVGDQDSLRLADRLFHNWLVDIAKVVTDLGSLAVVAVLVLAAAVVLVWRKEVAYAAVLIVGLVLTYAGARRGRRLELSLGARGVRDGVDRRRGGAQPRPAQRGLAVRLRDRVDRHRRRGRPHARVPARALHVRRHGRLGPGGRDLRHLRDRGAGRRPPAEQCAGTRRAPALRMSNEQIIYLVAACSGVVGLAAYIGLIVVPAWTAYSRVWERLAATFLTLYVLAGFLIVGVAGGAAVIWFWDRITG
jgi:membrane protein DedA with SNARE-associated domain